MDRRGGHAGCLHRWHRCEAGWETGRKRTGAHRRRPCRRVRGATEHSAEGTLPGAAARRGDRSRFEVVVRRRLPAYAVGGGRPSSSGTAGSGARNSAAISGGRSRPRWRAERTMLASTCWVSAPWRVAVAAAHLADDHGGPDGLFGAPVGGVERGVPQEEEHGREFVGQVRREALGVVERRRCVDQPSEAGVESAAGRLPSRARSVLPRCSGPAGRGRPAGPPAPRRPRDCRDDPPGGACSVGAK